MVIESTKPSKLNSSLENVFNNFEKKVLGQSEEMNPALFYTFSFKNYFYYIKKNRSNLYELRGCEDVELHNEPLYNFYDNENTKCYFINKDLKLVKMYFYSYIKNCFELCPPDKI